VQDKGSKVLCGKLGAIKITPSDCLYQEYLTINLGSTSDCRKLKLLKLEMEGQMLASRSSLGQRMQEEEQYAPT
jgi:hypothetical protein